VVQQVLFIQGLSDKENGNGKSHVQKAPQAFAGDGAPAIREIKFFKGRQREF
jgi:hypothetical protein